jgi:cyanate permease
VGPLIFGAVLAATGGYVIPWLVLSVVAAAVALTLPRLAPLVQRG